MVVFGNFQKLDFENYCYLFWSEFEIVSSSKVSILYESKFDISDENQILS